MIYSSIQIVDNWGVSIIVDPSLLNRLNRLFGVPYSEYFIFVKLVSKTGLCFYVRRQFVGWMGRREMSTHTHLSHGSCFWMFQICSSFIQLIWKPLIWDIVWYHQKTMICYFHICCLTFSNGLIPSLHQWHCELGMGNIATVLNQCWKTLNCVGFPMFMFESPFVLSKPPCVLL